MDSLELFVSEASEIAKKDAKIKELQKILEELDEDQKVQYVSYEITSNT